jgi:Ni/Co efflux regulator RcnB
MPRRLIALVCVLSLASPIASFAKHGGGGKKKGHDKDGGHDDRATVVVRFGGDERERVRGYFVEKHGRGHCPPGLAKKGNGCLPPGQAKKRYVVGRALPASVRHEPIPDDLQIRIGAPPSGYRYVLVDGDLVKLAIGTALVVDAIEGLVD